MPRIFDNIEQHLLPALKRTLTVSYRADFCVGYFNLRGWKQIDEAIEQWAGGEGHACRLMVGMQTTPQEELKRAFSLGTAEDGIDNATAIRLKCKLAEEFRQQLMRGAPTSADEAGLRRLAQQLRDNKVVVKLYLRHTLHAKLYLLFRDDYNNPITGYVGSSNLTFAGLSKQGELNVDVLDQDATQKLATWFKDRWEDKFCLDISQELIAVIEESWAFNQPTPYEVYLKMAYHLAQEARAGLSEFTLPVEFRRQLFDFQAAAVKIAAHHLNKRGGVLIGDVVGLGKTLMATALARIFEEDTGVSTLIICPKNLVPMWQSYVDRFGLRGKVMSSSVAIKELPNVPARFRLVLIDESHNFRNREGKTYRAIKEFVDQSDSRVILLTATPYNKTYLDLSAQLRLFVPEDLDLGIRPEQWLREIGEAKFSQYQVLPSTLAAFEKSNHADDWRELMRLFLVRRTRSFICLKKLTVLDPTVGSGAFLFAAMNIVEKLYEICLDKIEQFAADRRIGPKYPEFQAELARVAAHPNRCYFIFKSIIVNNLYGVDIMEEAVEICKLRLFLKLVSQISDADHIEPLPDIDFNIVPGNTLVGYASLAEVEQAASRSLFNLNLPQRITEADVALRAFRELQTQIGISARVLGQAKEDTKAKLAEIEAELNESLRVEYGAKKLEKFVESHRPFHWYVKFNTIMQDGGFDVAVGNPPYVEYSKIKDEYQIRGYLTEECGNLYAFCVERCVSLLRDDGRLGLVVQQPIVSTQRMKPVRDLVLDNASLLLSSTYDDRPSKLFDGIQHARIAILLMQKRSTSQAKELFVTRYNKWYREERPVLFQTLQYVKSDDHSSLGYFPKIGSKVEAKTIRKLLSNDKTLGDWISEEETEYRIYYKITGVGHWFTITTRPPKFLRQGAESSSSREQFICFKDKATRDRAFAILNSSLFFWFYQVRTNCRDFNPSDYKTFPVFSSLESEKFLRYASQLEKTLDASSTFISISHSLTGEIQVEQFRPRECKPIIDEIDRVLARHYGFTDEELEFIINYDIKYRMGKSSADEEAE